MSERQPLDVDGAQFTDAAHRVVEWVARYLRDVEQLPVLSRAAPGDTLRALPELPPLHGEPLAEIIADLDRLVIPGTTHWNHPGFFAYFAITGSVPGILGELVTAALNVNAMLWRTSPVATEMELRVLEWLRGMIGLHGDWFGITTDTASISTLLALAAAREARADLSVREKGLAGRADVPVMRVYVSEHTNSSVAKAAITLGFGHENVVPIEADELFRMRPDALQRAMEADVKKGMLPIAVVATIGTTSSGSNDPVPEIAEICARAGAWLHVDGAYAGVAAVVPEMRVILAGVEAADSLVINPHKWLFTPVECSVLYTRRPEVLRRAFALVPEYLVTSDAADTVNFMDYGVQLGHPFRALKLWMVIRAFGVDGIAARIRSHCEMAEEFAGWVDAEPEWELVAPRSFSLVCFRHVPADLEPGEVDAHNERIMAAVNASGEAYLSHTRLGRAYTIRLAIGNLRTERRHVARAWELLRAAAAR